MIWRESLPVRVALITTGLLASVLLVVTVSAYVITALMIQGGVDAALRTALPVAAGALHEVMEQAGKFENGARDYRYLQVLDTTGRVLSGPAHLPVDSQAVNTAVRQGYAFVSLVAKDGVFQSRRGPNWWLAGTPAEDELRVMYARVRTEGGPVVLQLAAPLGSVGEILPDLLKRLLLVTALGAQVCGLIAWRMAGETYRPLQAIIAVADEITTQTLSKRIPDSCSDRTLRRLTGVLNNMIGRLQEAFEVQGRFVAAAAHELRGPLSAMRAELEVALRRTRTPEEYRAALSGTLEETARLTALAEHLLMLARYERGTLLTVERNLPLKPLLERTAEEVRRSVGGEIMVTASESLVLDADPIALERMISNLAQNAIQAGGSPVRVHAEATRDGVLIQVEDQGKGIARETLPHLFEPFYRSDPARGRDGGTGLGLAIVKTVVDAHRGHIEVESEPRKGAIFRVFLPR